MYRSVDRVKLSRTLSMDRVKLSRTAHYGSRSKLKSTTINRRYDFLTRARSAAFDSWIRSDFLASN
ncbi:hypothetical protein [Leptospira noguchii]|uniref:hypothetical protein n=1 Tax=Leptospira noguchii TaxID=28182 RepID=UPI0002E09C68|nr:hypothetical protein [Leptospira noguchii]